MIPHRKRSLAEAAATRAWRRTTLRQDKHKLQLQVHPCHVDAGAIRAGRIAFKRWRADRPSAITRARVQGRAPRPRGRKGSSAPARGITGGWGIRRDSRAGGR